MKEIIIRCPVTQIPVRTGQLTTPTSFRAMAVTGAIEECAACGKPHAWDSREAWLIDAEAEALSRSSFEVE